MNDNLRLIGEPEVTYTEKELDALWLQYRIDKQFVSISDICENIASFQLKQREEAVVSDIRDREPKQGSPYWLETIKRPKWFAAAEIY